MSATFVLVPGACHGGWWYDPVVDRLDELGHRGVAVTPSGLGPEGVTAGPPITLESHVHEVTTAVRDAYDPGSPMVLVGHSYAGSVITGVADRVPELVAGLVYLDAFVPEDGATCWSMTNDEQRAWYVNGSARTGVAVDPLPFFDERARPHPLATLVQASRLTGAWRTVSAKHYVEALGWPEESPFAATVARVRADPGFVVHSWDSRHNVLADGPDRLVGLLDEVARSLRR